MPSSQYVYADANRTKGSMTNGRRRSQRIRRQSVEKKTANDTFDPDETFLEEDKDETILLSDEDNVAEEGHPLKSSDAMDVDEKCASSNDTPNHHHSTPASSASSTASKPMSIRGGATAGFLSNDPLTSSTLGSTIKSTPFNAKVRTGGDGGGTIVRINTKERLRKMAEAWPNDDDSDDDSYSLGDGAFLQAVAKRQAQRMALLEGSQQQSRTQQLQQQQENGSEDTAVMANHGGASSSHSPSESFAATQPWEMELGSLPSYPQNNAPQKDHRRQIVDRHQHAKQPSSNSLPSNQQNARQNHHRTQGHQARDQGRQATSNSLPSYDKNDQQSDHRPQERDQRYQGKQTNLSYQQNAAQNDSRTQEFHPRRHGKQNVSTSLPSYEQNDRQIDYRVQQEHHRANNTQSNYRGNDAASTVANPYHRKQPPPPTKTATAKNVPKISLEHLKSGKKSGKSNSRTNSSRGNPSSNCTNDGETWQEEAFRSSLLDLLGSFPSNYFNDQGDSSMDENETSLFFVTSASENNLDDDASPHSTTSQSAASAQLNRKRLFDAASRSLARLAIASRHASKSGEGGDRTSRSSGGGSSCHDDGESPDFNPPSPRSLPSYMSVMNVYDDSSPFGSGSGYWGGNANAMVSSSKEVFSGQSVHGLIARTVHLSSIPQGDDVSSSNPFSSWTLEQLACGSMVLAGQVLLEASRDPNFNGNHSLTSEDESCRVAGFAQTSTGTKGNAKRPAISSALVESSLGFLATAFACLESDFVYSVLTTTLGISDVTVFDALSHFAPVSSQGASTQDVVTIPVLSLLTLSRGLEAALHVARYATSLDPLSSPQDSCGGNTNCSIDMGIGEGGVGWLSALGRDLGLKLESNWNSRPRHMHLSAIAGYAYDFILEYNPMIVEAATDTFHGMSGSDDRNGHKRSNSRGGLYIDTQTRQGSAGIDVFVCRQSSVMRDRMYAANVEFLSSMIQSGIISGWLTSTVTASEGGHLNESSGDRTVERLCQKLFFVIETRSRLRRSTNQNTSKNDAGDSEAVCAASLSLLIIALPKHVGQSAPTSLSTSFRQMGNSTGTIEDLFQSPLVKKVVEMALSWKDATLSKKNSKENDAVAKYQAANAICVLSDICMAGGSTLISCHFRERLDSFLHQIVQSICRRGKSNSKDYYFDNSSIDSSIMFLLQLHTGSPILVRQFLRNFVEQSSASGDDYASCFVGGLLHLSANKSFSASSCASSLLRALIDGNPVDRTQDRLSEIILNSFDTEHAGSTIEGVLRSLIEATYSSVHCDVPYFCIRWHPRLCALGDLLGICTHSLSVINIFASSLSDEVLNLFLKALECDGKDKVCMDTLSGSANLSLLYLFTSFANYDSAISNDQNGAAIRTQQRNVKEKLIRASNFLTVLEVAMAQGTSADMTHRSLKLQNSLLSLSDERSLALTFTKASNTVARKENYLRDKLTKSELELTDMASKCRQIQLDRDNLSNAYHDMRLTYERRLEWTRSEAQMAARNVSEIHVHERKEAEEQCNEEYELRIKTKRENEKMKREMSSDKSRIKELEALLGQERKSRQDFESALDECKNELSKTSGEFDACKNELSTTSEKLSISEEKVSDLTATSEDAASNLEDTCAKLIKLATIYQSKESEMDKYKAELRSAVNTANSHADTAIQKYENARQQNKTLKKQLLDVSSELKDIKAHRADVQRMRKNAPVAYLNQLHNDPRIQEKKHSRRNRTGKENSLDGR
ncbi:hypothetical protein ACHAXR_009146 [Thalassiosira sp. AJA248-18]